MGKTIGYQIIYPPGCKQLSESLKIDELRRRLNDLSNSFDQIIEQESCEAADSTFDLDGSTQSARHENLKGLFLLLISPEYTQHVDVDIQLRVGVCICKLMKIFCPHNPFSGMLEERSLTKDTLLFILACITQLSNVKDKSDISYPKLHTILYICCQIDVFLWCASLGDETVLFECIKTAFVIVKNVNIWAWTEPTIICQMLLDMVVKVIAHSESLLTRDIITYILQFLIEPARSTQPEQHAFARDTIIRTANHLEYHVQMLLQNALISGNAEPGSRDTKPATTASVSTEPQPHTNGDTDATGSDLESEDADVDSTRVNPLGEHTFLVIYALHTIQDSLVAPVLPTIELKLKSPSERDRKRSFRLLARLFSEPNSLLHEKNPSLWEAFLGRFNDIDKEVRKLCVHMVPQLLKKNPDLPQERLLSCFKQRAYDPEEDVRLLVLRTVATLVNDSADGLNEALFDLLKERSRDKDLSIRKEASTALATIYKRSSQADNPSSEKLSAALNTILHMYYLPSVEDRVTVERLFKSSIVPYHLDTAGRVRALFICYGLIDEASIRAIQEMFKIQYSAMNLLRQVVHLLSAHAGQKISPEAGSNLMDRIHHLSNLLPKSEKSVEHLKRFFNHAHSDRAILNQLVRFTKPGCSCVQAANSMRDLLKRISAGGTGNAESHLNYARSVKVLLERSAPVLFDKELGHELLTQLVYVREASKTSALVYRLDIVRGLRLLWALTVYFRKILPVSEVLDYVITVLEESTDSTHEQPIPVSLPNSTTTNGSSSTSTTDPDPASVQELALNILCCILDGSSASPPSEPEVGRDPRATAAVSNNEPHFPGSESHLYLRSEQLLPLLRLFCCQGLTRLSPPVRARPPADTITASAATGTANPVRQPRGKGAAKPDATNPSTTDLDLYRAGLAWRRERRRAKLAARALLGLYRIANRSGSPRGPKGSALTHKSDDNVSSVDDDVDLDADHTEADSPDVTTELPKPTSRLGFRVQQALDGIIETCLDCPIDSPDYVTCLTTLSRIALLLPNVYNRQLKKLITKTLVQQVLVREEQPDGTVQSDDAALATAAAAAVANKPKVGTARSVAKARLTSLSAWLHDGCIPQTTRAKISALKLMTNWLRGLKNEVKPVAQAVIRLLHRIIIHEGDLTREGKLAPGEMSRMRLTAATSWLKLAYSQTYAENIEVDWYQSMTYIICDPCPHVRSHFLNKLSQGLMCLRLPLEYLAMFAHASDVADTAFKQRAKQLLIGNVQRRRDFLARHPAYMNDAKFLYGLLPDFVLPYLIYLLAHDPEWTDPNDVTRLTRIKSSLWFVMEPIVTRGQNFSFLRKIIEKIKHTRDALAPDDPIANAKLYTACDIALGLLLTRCPSLTIKEYPIEVKLPKSLFAPTPSSFKNPDFAQILHATENAPTGPGRSPPATDSVAAAPGKPLIQFTPAKHGRALKEGLMPPQLLKGSGKSSHLTESKPNHSDPLTTPVTQESSEPRTNGARLEQPEQATSPTQESRPRTKRKRQTKLQTISTKAETSVADAATGPPDVTGPDSTDRSNVREYPTLVVDMSGTVEFITSPKKHTRIVLGTPEIESDNTNSPIARIKKRGRPPKSNNQQSPTPKFRKLDFSPPKPSTSQSPASKPPVENKVRAQERQTPRIQRSPSVAPKATTRVAAPKHSSVQSQAKLVPRTTVKSASSSRSKASPASTRQTDKFTRAAGRRPTRLSALNAKQKLLSAETAASLSSSQASSNPSVKSQSPVKRKRT